MNIVCVICRELLTPAEDVFYTPCGHVFHFPCLTRWLERSKSCPQCREKVSQSKIHRIYFNFSNNETIEEDSTSLQNRVESLEFKLLLKEKDINHYVSKAESLDKQVHGLRKEVGRLENDIQSRNSSIFALQEQAKYLREKSLQAEAQQKELEKLREQVDLFRNIQTLVNSALENVNDMVRQTRDPNTLITYIAVMKQELGNMTNKRKEMRSMVKRLQQDVASISRERDLLADELLRRKKVEEKLVISQSKNSELERRLKAYEEKEQASEKSDDFLSENNVPQEKERPAKETTRRLHEDSDDAPVAKKLKVDSKTQPLLSSPILISEDSADEGATRKPANKSKENEENSPYLRLKSKGVSALKELHAQRSVVGTSHSIFGKKKRLTAATSTSKGFGPMTFDGYGGHSKPEIFPVPVNNLKIKKVSVHDAVKAKKQKLDGDLGDYVINLT